MVEIVTRQSLIGLMSEINKLSNNNLEESIKNKDLYILLNNFIEQEKQYLLEDLIEDMKNKINHLHFKKKI